MNYFFSPYRLDIYTQREQAYKQLKYNWKNILRAVPNYGNSWSKQQQLIANKASVKGIDIDSSVEWKTGADDTDISFSEHDQLFQNSLFDDLFLDDTDFDDFEFQSSDEEDDTQNDENKEPNKYDKFLDYGEAIVSKYKSNSKVLKLVKKRQINLFVNIISLPFVLHEFIDVPSVFDVYFTYLTSNNDNIYNNVVLNDLSRDWNRTDILNELEKEYIADRNRLDISWKLKQKLLQYIYSQYNTTLSLIQQVGRCIGEYKNNTNDNNNTLDDFLKNKTTLSNAVLKSLQELRQFINKYYKINTIPYTKLQDQVLAIETNLLDSYKIHSSLNTEENSENDNGGNNEAKISEFKLQYTVENDTVIDSTLINSTLDNSILINNDSTSTHVTLTPTFKNWWHHVLFDSSQSLNLLILDLWLMNKNKLRHIRQVLEQIFEWITKQWHSYYQQSTKEFQVKWRRYKSLQKFYIKQHKLKRKLLKAWFKNQKKSINQTYKTLQKQQLSQDVKSSNNYKSTLENEQRQFLINNINDITSPLSSTDTSVGILCNQSNIKINEEIKLNSKKGKIYQLKQILVNNLLQNYPVDVKNTRLFIQGGPMLDDKLLLSSYDFSKIKVLKLVIFNYDSKKRFSIENFDKNL